MHPKSEAASQEGAANHFKKFNKNAIPVRTRLEGVWT